jgi:hypothetical protein
VTDPAVSRPLADLGLFGALPPADPGRLRFAADLADHDRRRLEDLWRVERSKHPAVCAAPDCGARLLWLLTVREAWMPINADPDPAGNVVIDRRGCAQVAQVVAAGDQADEHTARYMPHHATCPAADRYRRPR